MTQNPSPLGDSEPVEHEWLTAEEVAAALRVSVTHAQKLCKRGPDNGGLRAKRLGTKWRIHTTWLDEFMGLTRPQAPAPQAFTARQARRTGR